MKYLLQGVVIVIFYIAFAEWATAVAAPLQTEPVLSLDGLQHLYLPVVFHHRDHAEMYDCSSCHHHLLTPPTDEPRCQRCHDKAPPSPVDLRCASCHTNGKTRLLAAPNGSYHTDLPGLLGALHLNCLGCHRLDSGPTECTGCHEFTPAGRNRFKVNGS